MRQPIPVIVQETEQSTDWWRRRAQSWQSVAVSVQAEAANLQKIINQQQVLNDDLIAALKHRNRLLEDANLRVEMLEASHQAMEGKMADVLRDPALDDSFSEFMRDIADWFASLVRWAKRGMKRPTKIAFLYPRN